MPDSYKLTFGMPDPIVIDSLPLSMWTIVNTNTLSINSDTITQLGIGGWYESMFVSFTVPESGSYKISYDYNITNAKVGNHGTYGFGLWLTTNNPNVSGDAQSSFYSNVANRTGSIIGGQNENISGKHGTASFNANLIAGTTYYLWYPGAALDDGTTYTLTFTNIRIYNNPIKYNYNNLLVFNNWEGYVAYNVGPRIIYTTLWETDTPFKNMYSITLNDSLDNYDEFIVYGSAVRSTLNLGVQNRYPVNHNGVNQCGSYYAGMWENTDKYILENGTDMWLEGTSGYISSSHFIGEGNNTTAFAAGIFNNRTYDVHPYKIVGVKEVE
jgi:hypothetical protein